MSTTTTEAGAPNASTPTQADESEAAQPPERADDDQPPRPLRPGVELDDQTRRLDRASLETLRSRLHKALLAACRHAGADPDAAHDVRIIIVGDAEMERLHAYHKEDPTTTDVLTFDLRDEARRLAPTRHPLDVEIVLCLDEARRQAERRAIPLEHELLLYAVHALLHCLGHDDADEQRARTMHEAEDAILGALGLEPVYAAPDRSVDR